MSIHHGWIVAEGDLLDVLRQMLRASIPERLGVFGSHHDRAMIAPFFPPDATGMTALLIVILAALMLGCIAMRARELVHIKSGRD